MNLRDSVWAWYWWLISPFYFFPIVLLLLCLYLPSNKLIITIKRIFIIMLFWLLIIQPFFYKTFINEKDPLLNDICYSREFADSTSVYKIIGSQCFKIFEPYGLFHWMPDFGIKRWEIYSFQNNYKLEKLLIQKKKLESSNKNVIEINTKIKALKKSLLLSEMFRISNNINNKINWYILKMPPFDLEKLKYNYESYNNTYGKDKRIEEVFEWMKKDLTKIWITFPL